ncbi:hypothetical protein CYLTODRAFT_170522 [Cylindrobasidium torrendii FP15055 ss-10]|uniref:Uncharacterized protein n=1 Tax=Cylindrobasidium torrendii FP15055 ss-10 TaxID=1314674 RepID=A0A0D7AZ77_9AGAR|nr:hypothetical protein CYLTODRAFT_170522 [Cylindrobasidium torrendii FP15055 ss-10]
MSWRSSHIQPGAFVLLCVPNVPSFFACNPVLRFSSVLDTCPYSTPPSHSAFLIARVTNTALQTTSRKRIHACTRIPGRLQFASGSPNTPNSARLSMVLCPLAAPFLFQSLVQPVNLHQKKMSPLSKME